MTESPESFEKTGLRLLMVTLVVVTIFVAYLAIDVILLGFLGILFAVFLVKVSELMGRFIPLGYGWNLGILVTLLLAISIVSVALFGVSIESQVDEASKRIDESSQKLKEWLHDRPVAMSTIESVPFVGSMLEDRLSLDEEKKENQSSKQGGSSPDSARQTNSNEQGDSGNDPSKEQAEKDKSPDQETSSDSSSKKQTSEKSGSSNGGGSAGSIAGNAMSVAGKILKTTFGALTNFAVILFIGIFIASSPTLYRDGFARLFAIEYRSRVVEVMDKMGNALFNWLIGRSIAMLVTGVGTGIALWLLGVPLAFTVGAITGILTFIPNIGGIIALLLAMLMAMSQGPQTVIWVVVIYAVLQLVESNILTPLVQQHQTSIPPAMLIAFQIFMGVLVGFLGVLVSTPMLAATLILVNEFWVKDVLGDHADSIDEIPGIDDQEKSE